MRYNITSSLLILLVVLSIVSSFYKSVNLKTISRNIRLKSIDTNSNDDGLNFNDLFQDDLDEINDPVRLIFEEGHRVPKWLKGTLIRNGPAVFGSLKQDGKRYNHLFDGLAKLSRFSFDDTYGEIVFQHSFIRSSWYDKIVKNIEDIPPSVVTGPVTPPFNLIENIYSALTSSTLFDNVPVNIHQIGGNNGPVVATTDAPVLLQFDPTTLQTRGKVQYKNSIVQPGGVELFSTAHPQYYLSKEDNETYTINYFLELRPLPIPFYPDSNIAHIVKINSNLERTKLASIPIGNGIIPYVHSFSITENYAILMIFPLYMDLSKIVNGQGFLPQLEWKKHSNDTQIYVIDLNKKASFDKKTGASDNVIQYNTKAMWAYHHINAFEEDNTITIDVNGYENADIVTAENGFLYIPNAVDPVKRKNAVRDGNWFRIKVPMSSSAGSFVNFTQLPAIDKHGKTYTAELIRTNENLLPGTPIKYSYGLTGFPPMDSSNNYGSDKSGVFKFWSIVKMDHDAAQSLQHNKESKASSISSWSYKNCYPSESIYVSRHKERQDHDDDDGVVLSIVYEGNKRESFLLVLDAKSMEELGRCYLKKKICFSFHGVFLPSLI